MNNLKNLPVLVLAYNRFDKFKYCIDTLAKYEIKKIFISIDGPKNDFDLQNQSKIYSFCSNNRNDANIIINQLKINYGCRIAPLKGISWFFSKNKYGVILEDDVIVSKKCMEVFLFLLEKNINKKNFMSITSFNEFTNKKIESVYTLPVWRSWGWACWADRWNYHLNFSKKIKDYNIWKLYQMLPEHFKSMQTAKIIKASQLNLLDAWDYEFNFSHIVNNKSSLTIGGINNYVYGFDSSATHTIDIESIGIDFSLFSERKIDLGKVKKINLEKEVLTLNKCGFLYKENIFLLKNLFNYIFSIYQSFLLRVRIIKRIMYKSL